MLERSFSVFFGGLEHPSRPPLIRFNLCLQLCHHYGYHIQQRRVLRWRIQRGGVRAFSSRLTNTQRLGGETSLPIADELIMTVPLISGSGYDITNNPWAQVGR